MSDLSRKSSKKNLSRKKMRDIREIVMAVAQTKSEARSLAKALKEGLTQTFDEIHAGPINPEYFYPLGSNVECSSQHSKKLYKLTRQLTHIKNRLETHPDNQTYSKLLLDSVEEVIGLITSYREETRELPFDWIKQRFLIEDHRGKKLIYPPGNHSQLMAIRPKLVYYESDDECDTCDTVEGSLKDPNFSGLGRLDLVISNPLVDHGTKALAVSYLSCLESICKTFEDLSKEKDKRLTDIYMGVGVPEVYTAEGEMHQHKEIAALTKNGLRSRLEEDRQRHLQSYSIQTTNSDLRRIDGAKGKTLVEEPDDTINVEEEEMDDDFVYTAWDNSGLRRSQRNKGKELADEREREKPDSDNNDLRRIGRAKGKALVEEPDDTINVEGEEADDDVVQRFSWNK